MGFPAPPTHALTPAFNPVSVAPFPSLLNDSAHFHIPHIAVVRNIKSINIWYALRPWASCLTELDNSIGMLIQSNSSATVSDVTDIVLNSNAGQCLEKYATRLGADWNGQVALYASLAANNIQSFSNLLQALAYTLLLKLFSASKFEPDVCTSSL